MNELRNSSGKPAIACSSNLGIATDLALQELICAADHKPLYTVIRTPQAPDYYFGNMLLLSTRPTAKGIVSLESAFDEEFGGDPRIKHRAFTWPERRQKPQGLHDYLEAGYELSHNCVFIADRLDLRKPDTDSAVRIRKFRAKADWDAWMAMHFRDIGRPDSTGSYARCLEHQQAVYKYLTANAYGDWWGAYVGEVQVASAGLFFVNGVGRFQSVITHEKYRNRGICKHLLSTMSEVGFSRVGRLVIVADTDHHAEKVYRSLGFSSHQWFGTLCQEVLQTEVGRYA